MPNIRSEVISHLPFDKTATQAELNLWLELCEKDQYADYTSGKITFAQFRSSVAQRKLYVTYTVLDDIIDDLLP